MSTPTKIRRSRTIPMLVLSVLTLVITLSIAPETCKADSIAVVYVETPTSFTLNIMGGSFAFDESHNVVLGTNWNVTVDINEDAGFFNDVLTIKGTALHLFGPHGEGPNQGPFIFNISVPANLFAEGAHAIPILGQIGHEVHFDRFVGSLSFMIAGGDITGYTLTLNGEHVIPEPATMFLLGTGLAGIAIKMRNRLKSRKSGQGSQ